MLLQFVDLVYSDPRAPPGSRAPDDSVAIELMKHSRKGDLIPLDEPWYSPHGSRQSRVVGA